MRRRDDDLEVLLVHCKFSSEPKPGARIEDLYDVCGQAMKMNRAKSIPDQLARRSCDGSRIDKRRADPGSFGRRRAPWQDRPGSAVPSVACHGGHRPARSFEGEGKRRHEGVAWGDRTILDGDIRHEASSARQCLTPGSGGGVPAAGLALSGQVEDTVTCYQGLTRRAIEELCASCHRLGPRISSQTDPSD